MPRSPRIELPGAMYPVLARGNRREDIVLGDDDRWMFLRTLGEMAGRTEIRVHAYALMDNHYHLVIETPKANLVDGMKWFQTTYTRRFNVKNTLWGHLFGGRYKAIVVQHQEGDYYQQLMDYVHLNPVRAGMIGEGEGFDSMEWTSLREYRKPPTKRFEWMESTKGFETVGLPDTTAGRRRYLERLETLVDWSKPTEAGKVLWEGQSLQSTLRRGWYFGSQAFREKLLDRLGRVGLDADRKTRKRYTRADLKDHEVIMARRIVAAGLECTGLEPADLAGLRKNDERKALIAHILMERTSVPQQWINPHFPALRSGPTSGSGAPSKKQTPKREPGPSPGEFLEVCRHRAGQGVEVVATLKRGHHPSLGMLLGRVDDPSRHPGEVRFIELQPPERIVPVGVKAGRNEDQLGPVLFDGWRPVPLDRAAEVAAPTARGKRSVHDVVPVHVVIAVWIERVLETRTDEYLGPVLEHLDRAVAMMNVEIKHRDALDLRHRDRRRRPDCNMVEETEAHRGEHASSLAPRDERHGFFQSPGRQSGRAQRPRGHRRVTIKRDQPLLRHRSKEVIEICSIMDVLQRLPADEWRLPDLPVVEDLRLAEIAQDRLTAFRTLRMTGVHPVGVAVVVREKDRVHEHWEKTEGTISDSRPTSIGTKDAATFHADYGTDPLLGKLWRSRPDSLTSLGQRPA
jgi:putative transposase